MNFYEINSFTADKYNSSPEKEKKRENRNNNAKKENNNQNCKKQPLSPGQMPNQILLWPFATLPLSYKHILDYLSHHGRIFQSNVLLPCGHSVMYITTFVFAFPCLAHLFPAHLLSFYPSSYSMGYRHHKIFLWQDQHISKGTNRINEIIKAIQESHVI